MGGGMTPTREPPRTGAGPAALPLAAGELVELDEPPQAASRLPAAVIENPKTDARTSICRRVILPWRTWSTRCCPYSFLNSSDAISIFPLRET